MKSRPVGSTTSILRRSLAAAMLLILGMTAVAHSARIKDIADLKGVRSNQLVGYGLVVGLDGTGDGSSSRFTVQSMASMLEKMGVTIPSDAIKVKNVAAVMVTAELPAFARSGSRIDSLVSSIGDAKNLQGGTLLMTPLRAPDGQVYAVAQGPVSTGGFAASGSSGSNVQKNFPTVGRVVEGTLVEREVKTRFNEKESLTFALHHPDFTTAARMASAINSGFAGDIARTPDAGTVEIDVPDRYRGRLVEMVSLIEGLAVDPDTISKVIVNERTGTVIMGENVRISTVAIAHGNLSIQISESLGVSQPLPFSEGRTAVLPESDIRVEEGNAPVHLMESGISIGEVVRALNALGVSPRDLIAIFQALKSAGALQAQLEII
ncbi:MAG: flagellar basal body P-ring protein FlgI [Desulfobacterales bacterium]